MERLDNVEIVIASASKKLEDATNLINELKGTNASIAENNKKLKEDYEELQDYIFDLDCRIIQTEQYSRRESIVITGISDKIYQKDLEKCPSRDQSKGNIFLRYYGLSSPI